MSWTLGLSLGVFALLIIYLLARFLFIWFVCGGNDGGNYYSDSEK